MSIGTWKRAVKRRDGGCVLCGTTEDLHAHHICSKKERPDLIFDVYNGVTLCAVCHAGVHERAGDLIAAARRGGLKGGAISRFIVARANDTHEKAVERGRKYGPLGGRAVVEKYGGWFEANKRRTRENRVATGGRGGMVTIARGGGWHRTNAMLNSRFAHQQFASHSRWHVARGVVSSTCPACQQAALVAGRE